MPARRGGCKNKFFDYDAKYNGQVQEINTTPGMTPTSFIPQQVAAAGMEMQDVLTEVIEEKLR